MIILKVKIYECDLCGKRVDDRYLQNGWVIIGGDIELCKGRREDGTAIKNYFSNEIRDFCCMEHLVEYIKRGRKKQ